VYAIPEPAPIAGATHRRKASAQGIGARHRRKASEKGIGPGHRRMTSPQIAVVYVKKNVASGHRNAPEYWYGKST
jgi:hypothetical protein